MTPSFAQAIDPIFLHVLRFLDRLGKGERPQPQEERLRIKALLDQAEAFIGAGVEWDLAKYAIVSWIDEVLTETPWESREWWSNNVLEVELFQTRICNEQFYVRAQKASSLSRRDVLEVYYVCVVLGFRGLYRDPTLAAMFTQAHGLPADLETWARQTSLSIRLGQGRPPLAGPRREILGAPPLSGKAMAVWSWLAAILLTAFGAVLYFSLLTHL